MNIESLKVLRNIIATAINESDIELADKVEATINIDHYLEDYEENTNVLRKHLENKKRGGYYNETRY
jgi:hypothetical protein